MLKGIQEKAAKLTGRDITKLKGMKVPDAVVQNALMATLVILGHNAPKDWDDCKRCIPDANELVKQIKELK